MGVLVAGWPSFVHGVATAGDVLAMRRVHSALTSAGITADLAWSPRFEPDDGVRLSDVDARRYSHLIFCCGPLSGWQLCDLHRRFEPCIRIAVGVSVVDPSDPAVTGFHRVLPRDAGDTVDPDLATGAPTRRAPVVGVVLAGAQPEYGAADRTRMVADAVTSWLPGADCAPVWLDTRLDAADPRLCRTADEFCSIVERLDAVVTSRLHGMVLALRAGVPALAVDPIDGGGKVGAQASIVDWPAVLRARDLDEDALDDGLRWCLTEQARRQTTVHSGTTVDRMLDEVTA